MTDKEKREMTNALDFLTKGTHGDWVCADGGWYVEIADIQAGKYVVYDCFDRLIGFTDKALIAVMFLATGKFTDTDGKVHDVRLYD